MGVGEYVGTDVGIDVGTLVGFGVVALRRSATIVLDEVPTA
jgi:hypothetical protein